MTDPVTDAWMSRSRARWVVQSSTNVVRRRETGAVRSTPGTTPTPKQFRLSAGSRGLCRRDRLAIHCATLVWPPSGRLLISRSHWTRRILLSGERVMATQAISPSVTADHICSADSDGVNPGLRCRCRLGGRKARAVYPDINAVTGFDLAICLVPVAAHAEADRPNRPDRNAGGGGRVSDRSRRSPSPRRCGVHAPARRRAERAIRRRRRPRPRRLRSR